MLDSISRYSGVFILLLAWQSHAQLDRQIIYPKIYTFLADDPGHETWPRPEFDDRDWQHLPFGSFPFESWQGQGWFRYILEVDSARLETPLGFSLTLRGAAEVWLDGQLQYRFGAIETADGREQPAFFRNLQSLVFHRDSTSAGGKSRHLLAIRYANKTFNKPAWTGFRPAFGFAIGDLNAMNAERAGFARKVTANQLALMSISLAFGLLHLLLFAFYARIRINLYYAVLTVLAAINIFFELQPYLVNNAAHVLLAKRLAQISFALFALACLRFMYAINYPQRPKIFLLFAATGLALSVWSWRRPFAMDKFLFIYMLAVIAEIGRAFIATRKRQKAYAGVWIIGLGASFLIAAALHNILGSFGLIPQLWSFVDFPTPYYGMLGFMISMSVFLARHFAQTNLALEARLVEVKELSEKTLQQELERARLEAENERKTRELEEARKIQLAMLPRILPELPNIEIAVHMRPATEVGGDYYDFKLHDDGTLTAAIGDAMGHGLQAGTMVSATKGMFNAMADDPSPVHILQRGTKAFKELGLRQMFMAMTVAKFRGNQMQVAAAGMPYTLVYRAASRSVEEIELKGMPLGSFSAFPYQEKVLSLNPGDTVLFMSDGFTEMFNNQNELLGEERAKDLFQAVAEKSPQEVIAYLNRAGEKWANGRTQQDDVTFVVIKIK